MYQCGAVDSLAERDAETAGKAWPQGRYRLLVTSLPCIQQAKICLCHCNTIHCIRCSCIAALKAMVMELTVLGVASLVLLLFEDNVESYCSEANPDAAVWQ